jgi:hypothetical protein
LEFLCSGVESQASLEPRIGPLRKRLTHTLLGCVLIVGCTTHQTVRFETVPEKAYVAVNGVPLGQAPVSSKLLTDAMFTGFGARRHTIVAEKECFEDETIIIQSKSIFFSNPEPFPETITLRLKSKSQCNDEDPSTSP